jgi:hypothetical protein
MYIHHIKSGATMSAQFNPVSVSEQFSASYERLSVLGLSMRPLQYTGNDNPRISMELRFDGRSIRDLSPPGNAGFQTLLTVGNVPANKVNSGSVRTELARRFIVACLYPSEGAQDVSGGAPSRLIFQWPRMYSAVVRLLNVKHEHSRFSITSRSTLLKSDIEFEVEWIKRPTFEYVMKNMLRIQRSGNPEIAG